MFIQITTIHIPSTVKEVKELQIREGNHFGCTFGWMVKMLPFSFNLKQEKDKAFVTHRVTYCYHISKVYNKVPFLGNGRLDFKFF